MVFSQRTGTSRLHDECLIDTFLSVCQSIENESSYIRQHRQSSDQYCSAPSRDDGINDNEERGRERKRNPCNEKPLYQDFQSEIKANTDFAHI